MLPNYNRDKRIIFDAGGLPFLAEDFHYEQDVNTRASGVGGKSVLTGTTTHTAGVTLSGTFIHEEMDSLVRGPQGSPTQEVRVQTDDREYVFENAMLSYDLHLDKPHSVAEVQLTAPDVTVLN